MSVLTRATRRNNPEDIILHSHRRENLKSYTIILIMVLAPGFFFFSPFIATSLYPELCALLSLKYHLLRIE
jgi:hypothetical protein